MLQGNESTIVKRNRREGVESRRVNLWSARVRTPMFVFRLTILDRDRQSVVRVNMPLVEAAPPSHHPLIHPFFEAETPQAREAMDPLKQTARRK